jgi:hypothetical protein
MTDAARGMKKQVSAAIQTIRMLGPAAAAEAEHDNYIEQNQVAKADASLED